MTQYIQTNTSFALIDMFVVEIHTLYSTSNSFIQYFKHCPELLANLGIVTDTPKNCTMHNTKYVHTSVLLLLSTLPVIGTGGHTHKA